MGNILLSDHWGSAHVAEVEQKLSGLKGPQVAAAYVTAVKKVVAVRQKDESSHPIPALYFKNAVSQKRLNASLSAAKTKQGA